MAYIKNIDPNAVERILPDEGLTIGAGEVAEVSDELAANLAKQENVWQLVNQDGAQSQPATETNEAGSAKAEEAK